MINHYNILKVSRMSSNEEIKLRAKKLLKDVKISKIQTCEKNKLSKQIYESYQFLRDYHKRKSLDNHLDSEYTVLDKDAFSDGTFSNIFSLIKPLTFNIDGLENKIKQMGSDLTNNKNRKTYFYSSSSTTSSNMDKDGNLVWKTKEVINNNGKKNENEYNTVTKKEI